MIISVDTGNKQMKTENCEFNSGVENFRYTARGIGRSD